MRASALAAGFLAIILLSGGCGVPSEGSVVTEGRGRTPAPASGDDGTSEPATRGATTDPQIFLDNFLAAAAGDPKKAVGRVRAFFPPEMRDSWSPPPEVLVVRRGDPIIDRTALGYQVRLPVTLLGKLGENGTFQPQAAEKKTYSISIANNVESQTGLFVVKAPADVLLLSDQALQLYFELRTIYFWSQDHRTLVPDLRYLPRRDVPVVQRPTMIIEWLLRGSSPWLQQAVEPLPQEARLVGKVPAATDDMLKVVLTKVVKIEDRVAVERLATQLRWSLRSPTGAEPKLDLRVDHTQYYFTDSSYLQANRAYRDRREPVRYCVVRGEVRTLSTTPAGAALIPRVPEKWNRQVVRAALAVEGTRSAVAVIRTGPGGRLVLDVGGADGAVETLVRTDLLAKTVSQPVWLPGDPSAGLLVADNALLSFRAAGGSIRAVQNSPPRISTFALAPDARRMAYIAEGRLYVAPLLRVGGVVMVGDSQQVPTTLTRLTTVAWSQQDWLIVAGKQDDGLVALREITVDGAVQAAPGSGQFGTQPVVHLVASTDDPINGRGPGEAMYVANGLSYQLFSQPRLLTVADVNGPTPSPQPSGAGNPMFPFFLG